MKAAYTLIFFSLLINAGDLSADPSVRVQLYDVQVYFPHSTIYVEVTIENTGPDIFRFKMAENRIFNLSFLAHDITGKPLEPNIKFITQRATDQVYFREVSLEAGERFSFVEAVNDYITLPGVGSYLITAEFYPHLYRNQNRTTLLSNTLRISVRPGGDETTELTAEIDHATAEILEISDISPDAVVRYTIEARQQSNWNRFFLYLDLESLLLQSPGPARRYQASSESTRVNLLAQYKEDLQSGNIDPAISFIPHEFEIQRVEFGPHEGKVMVLKIFEQGNFRELKQYTYELTRTNYWKITGYSVANLGTEAVSN